MRSVYFLSIVALITLGCAQGRMTETQGRTELNRLDVVARNGTASDSVKAGEAALQLVNKVDYAPVNPDHSREVASDIPSAQTITKLREADSYTETGEQSFIYEAFDESLRIFQMAYEKDPHNEKANAYLAVLIPMKYLKGIKWRISKIGEEKTKLGFELMNLLSKTPDQLTYNDQFNIFLMTPFKKRFNTRAEFIDEAIAPEMKALVRCLKFWDALSTDPQLDIELRIPTIMRGLGFSRFRHEDTAMASSFYIGGALYLKLWTLYNPGDMPMHLDEREKKMNQLWTELSQNPAFGILTDPLFYPLLQGRIFQFTKGMDIATHMLQDRDIQGRNSEDDLLQFTPDNIQTCTPLIPREIGEGFYYKYWVKCPDMKDVKAPSVLTESLSPSGRKELSEPNLRYEKENEWGQYYEGDQWSEPYQANEQTNTLTANNIRQDLRLLRKLMSGPEKMNLYCRYPQGDDSFRYPTWIDFPTYLKDPVKDVKKLNVVFSKDGPIASLSDPTLHGLFPQGYPCLRGLETHGLESAIVREPEKWVEPTK